MVTETDEWHYDRKPYDQYQSDMDSFECKECGYVYDADAQDPPEGATIYWVPHCPYCNAGLTSTPVTESEVVIGINMARNGIVDDEDVDEWLDKMQARARHLHGREVHDYAHI